jgi:MoxR-like ATPase
MTYPFYTDEPIKEFPKQPVELPPSCQHEQTRPEDYLPDKGLVDAVNVALLLGQPLLLTGQPGAGKTQLAYHLAYQLGLQKPLKFSTKSTSTSRDLFYTYDALGRFHAAQVAQLEQTTVHRKSVDYMTYTALGKAIVLTNPLKKVKAYLPSTFEDYSEPRRSVVLIDEIDKAPRDFPNDILDEVENWCFRIPELGNVEIQAADHKQPILILTSNSEKPLPEAFLRRCIYYDIPFPDKSRLQQIVEKRLSAQIDDINKFLGDALGLFYELQKSPLRKKPSTAELLNWLLALRDIFKGVDNPFSEPKQIERTISSLVKMAEDRKAAKIIVEQWCDKQ